MQIRASARFFVDFFAFLSYINFFEDTLPDRTQCCLNLTAFSLNNTSFMFTPSILRMG